MVEFELNDITLQGDVISGQLHQEAAAELKHYANTLNGNHYYIKLLVEAVPVRRAAEMAELQPPPFQIDYERLAGSLGARQRASMAGANEAKAMRIVSSYVFSQLEKTDPVSDFEIYIVWFAYTLGNWKALLSTTLSDGMYYEVTYDKAMHRTYLDAYKKFSNQMIPD
jgi:hypothetical protein